jgi:hypothetical protein
MNKWVSKFLCLIASLLVGCVIGYAVMTFRVVASSPFGLNRATIAELVSVSAGGTGGQPRRCRKELRYVRF